MEFQSNLCQHGPAVSDWNKTDRGALPSRHDGSKLVQRKCALSSLHHYNYVRDFMSSLVPHPGNVPVIETERLRLRGHLLQDFPDSAALWADPLVTRFIGGKPLSEEEVWARVLRYVGHWAWMGFGYWVVEERSTGRFAGEVGFADWKRDIEPSLQGLHELGWVLASSVHGMGYATEAVRAAIAWGEAHFDATSSAAKHASAQRPVAPQLGAARMVCIIDPDNTRSIRVAEKCGFKEVQHASYKGEPTILLAR
jgi:RimJ/RimL family protein N-acetyltransferase